MKRRKFLKQLGSFAAAAVIAPHVVLGDSKQKLFFDNENNTGSVKNKDLTKVKLFRFEIYNHTDETALNVDIFKTKLLAASKKEIYKNEFVKVFADGVPIDYDLFCSYFTENPFITDNIVLDVEQHKQIDSLFVIALHSANYPRMYATSLRHYYLCTQDDGPVNCVIMPKLLIDVHMQVYLNILLPKSRISMQLPVSEKPHYRSQLSGQRAPQY